MNAKGNKLLAVVAALGCTALALAGAAYLIRPYLGSPSHKPTLAAADRPAPAKVKERPDRGPWGREELLRAALKVPLADVSERTVMPPALEVERQKAETRDDGPGSGVRVTNSFECAIPLEARKLSDSHFSLRITTSEHRNWFMFRVEGVPAGGKVVRLDLEQVELGIWGSLNPVYYYGASLDDLSAFDSKPAGGKPAAGHNGPLLPDTSGQSWHYMPDTWGEGGSRLCFVHRFERDAYVAMRVPYTPRYDEAYLATVKGRPGAELIPLGKSLVGRPLHVLRIGSGDPTKTPCIFMYAREHADEHDPSWVVQGAIEFLLSDTRESRALRERFTFLFLPILDPDGAADSVYERLTHCFIYSAYSTRPEPVAYAGFFDEWVDAGKRLDLVINLHNMDSGEMPHLWSVVREGRPVRVDAGYELDTRFLRPMVEKAGFAMSKRAREGGAIANFRLGGYLGYFCGPLHMPYEVNSQEKGRHLTLLELRRMGELLVQASAEFLASDRATPLFEDIEAVRRRRVERIGRYLAGASGVTNPLQKEWMSLRMEPPASAQVIPASGAAAVPGRGSR